MARLIPRRAAGPTVRPVARWVFRRLACLLARPLQPLVAAAVLFMAAMSTPVTVSAQEPVDTSVIRLDTLPVPVTRTTVSAARAPVSLSLVGRDRIQRGLATIGLHESLASVPGLIVDNRQNFSLGNRIVIRGLGARAAFGVRGLRVLVDGIPLTMPDGQTNLNNLDLGSAGSIHVLRGPASALFGNAAGGVIAVETEPAPGPRSVEARVTAGDQGRSSITRLWKLQAKVAETIGSVDYLASVSRMETDGDRDHSRAEQTQFNSRIGIRAGDATRVTLVVNAVDMPLAQNPGSLPLDSARAAPEMAWQRNVDTGSGERTRQGQIGVRLRHDRPSARADVSVHALRRSLENPLPFGVIDLQRAAGGMRGLYERRVGSGAVTAGLDIEAQRDDRREFANDGGQPTGTPRRDQQDRVTSAGPFAQARLERGRAGVTLGARYDIVRFETIDHRPDVDQSGQRTLHAPSVMVGASTMLADAVFFANVASAFQTPTTTELINAPPAPGEECCPVGFNTDLEPQRLVSTEMGIRGTFARRLSYEASAYLMNVRDALVQFEVPEAEGRSFFRNAGRTRHRGIEIAMSAPVATGIVLSGAYTLTDVRFRDDGSPDTQYENRRVPGITPHRIFASAAWSPGRSRISVDVQHNSSQHADDANTTESPRFTVVDLRARTLVAFGTVDVEPFMAIHNVFDAGYFGSLSVNAVAGRFYEPAPGRNLLLGFSIRTGGWRGS